MDDKPSDKPKPLEEHPTMKCPVCGKPAVLRPAKNVYWTFNKGLFWTCADFPRCDTYVGCHGETKVAKGTMADAQTRRFRRFAHEYFDDLWYRKMINEGCSKADARTAAYMWLARQMDITISECHIGKFDVEQCRRVIAICMPYVKKVKRLSEEAQMKLL